MSEADAEALIGAQLWLSSVPGLPELLFHTAHARSGLSRLAGNATPYWAYPWAGGLALARFILDDPAIVAGRRVLDFGCGGGLVAIAAAKAGVTRVVAFDSDPLARVAVRLNAKANGVSVCVPEAVALPPSGIDLVLAGDVFYAAGVARRVTNSLRKCREAGVSVLVGDVGRRHLPRSLLREVARHPVTEFGGAAATGIVFAFEP